MKISIYFDVYPWTVNPEQIYPTTKLHPREDTKAKRYRVDVEIPDPRYPDVVIQGETKEVP